MAIVHASHGTSVAWSNGPWSNGPCQGHVHWHCAPLAVATEAHSRDAAHESCAAARKRRKARGPGPGGPGPPPDFEAMDNATLHIPVTAPHRNMISGGT